MPSTDRRAILKTMAAGAAVFGLQSVVKAIHNPAPSGGHTIIIVFDAWTAENVDLYGYGRATMPNLKKWAEKAIVYRRHHSAGSFTVPGVASLLTSNYPFQHRALTLKSRMAPQYRSQNIFSAFLGKKKTEAFAQNYNAAILVDQCKDSIEQLIPANAFSLGKWMAFDLPIFSNDAYNAYQAVDAGLLNKDKATTTSLILSPLYKTISQEDTIQVTEDFKKEYPSGLPENPEMYTLAGIRDGLISTLEKLSEPSLVYFHIFTPHWPYHFSSEFRRTFLEDGFTPETQEKHPLVTEPYGKKVTLSQRRLYDAYLACWDDYLAKVFDFLESSGLRENSTIAFTSDHGEMFDRGVIGHLTDLLHEPVLHIPLIVTRPGLETQINVETPTCSVDLLPTFCALAGIDKPAWAEGVPLPEMGGEYDPKRVFFAFDAKNNPTTGGFKKYSIALYRNFMKLTYYHQNDEPTFELYDIQKDPAEKNNLANIETPELAELKQIMFDKLKEIGAER